MKNIIKFLVVLISVSLILVSCTKETSTTDIKKLKSPITKTNYELIHTVIDITLYDKGNEYLIDSCFDLIAYYESILSGSKDMKDTSEIYALNNAHGDVVTLSDDVLDCLISGFNYSRDSNGIFDITIGKLSNLWNFENATTIPKDYLIQEALTTVDYNNIVIDGNDVYLKNPDTVIELGGISKGYIADKVAEYLKSQGVESALINLGGNVVAIGYRDNNTNQQFKVGIREPVIGSSNQIGYVEINNMSVVSSGGYEQFIEDKETNKIYSHILDTSTGYPIETDIAQVTIFSKKSVDGDALSTISYALGSDKAIELIESIEDTECLIIKNDGTYLFSKNVGYENDKLIKFTKS